MRISGLMVVLFVLDSALGTRTVAQTSVAADSLRSSEQGGPRRWEVVGSDLALFVRPSVDSEIIGSFSNGDVLSNLGCLEGETGNWCEVRSFRGGPRGFVDARSLRPAIGTDGVVAMGIDTSKRRAQKRDFDEQSKISCAQERGQNMGSCIAAVARSGGGDATVVVTYQSGFSRMLFFVHGEFVRASATMSGVGTDFDWHITSGEHVIRVDDQRFEIPTAFVLGGG